MTKPKKPLIEGDWSEPEFEYLATCKWIGTEKIDGTNTRIIFTVKGIDQQNVTSLEFKGKTDDAVFFPGMKEKLGTLFSIDQLVLQFHDKWEGAKDFNITFYGETFGPNINKGGNYRDELDFILFDIKIGDWWLKRNDVEEIAEKLGLQIVPIVFEGTLLEAIAVIKQGFDSTISIRPLRAEGMVLVPAVQLFSRKGERIITKLKQKDFAK